MSKVAPRSPPLKPVHGASWVQTIHAFWAGSPKGAATVAPLAILESAGSASDDETELKDGDAYEQATELLYEAQVRSYTVSSTLSCSPGAGRYHLARLCRRSAEARASSATRFFGRLRLPRQVGPRVPKCKRSPR
jgi:hypothetical protein